MNNPRTNIVWYVLCWNEKPILPFMVDYWKRIANKVVVYDNNSTDGSLEYLSQFDWIETRPYTYSTNDQLNDDINRRIKNECWKECKGHSEIDWVIVSDLDEILWSRSNDLDANLACLKFRHVAIAQPFGCDFMSETFPDHDSLLLHEKIKTYQHVEMWNKCIVFDPALVDEINYDPGAHTLRRPIFRGSRIGHENSDLLLFHFKYLSVDYLINKRFATKPRISAINKRNHWGYEYDYNRQQIENQFNTKWTEARSNNIDSLVVSGPSENEPSHE